MTTDPGQLRALLEESQDLQADAVRATTGPLEELVANAREAATAEGTAPTGQAAPAGGAHHGDQAAANREFATDHRRSLHHSLAGATILGAAGGGLLVGLLASPALASTSPDIQMLQTAASIEVLAVSTYATALTLPYIGGATANPVVTKFCQVTKDQHTQHGKAFNAAITRLGGKVQQNPDPVFVPVVNKAVAGLAGVSPSQGALGVVALALELENVAAETYVNDAAKVTSSASRALFASIMGVEAQHASVLLAVQALLQAGAPQLISLSPTTVASLPAAAGSVGFPNAFYPTSQAAPATQGAVK